MRSISAASLAKLQEKTGTEPITIVEIDWVNSNQSEVIGPLTRYADREFTELELNGKILQVANIEDILNVSKSGVSQSVALVLDDTDGSVKQIFNNVDIHKKRVWIYQWFSGIPITEKFLLFAGVIASPVVWKEGDRTLAFTVISKGEDKEIGFSPEEGQFPTLPQNLVGTVWPLVFGKVAKLPFQRVDEITYRKEREDDGSNSSPVTTEGTGIEDPAIQPHLDQSSQQAANAQQLAQVNFIGYLQASGRARRAGELQEFDAIQKGKGPWSSLAKQFLDQGNKYLLEAQAIRRKIGQLIITQNAQKDNTKKSIGVTNGEKMPQGVSMDINLGGAKHTGYFLGNQFVITNRVHPEAEKYGMADLGTNSLNPLIPRDTFFWADAGSPVGYSINEIILDEHEDVLMPVRYIVSSTVWTTVQVVWAMRTINDVTSIYPVPVNYYRQINTMFGTLPVTMIYCPIPLSARVNANGKSEGWDDELWGFVSSPIGPNTVDILRWIIETYTTHEIDETSFDEVRELVDPYPSNFALQDRPQVMQVLADIAYQARCIIWLKNNKFYIKYKPKRDTSIATITEADVIENTLEVSYTESEDLTTKYLAEWRSEYKSGKKNLVILRYNIAYYGVHEKRYDYFIYTQQQLVEKSATFWLIREANTFKQCTFKVPIKFLNIETLDTITLDFDHPFIANGPVDCLVEEAVVNTQDYTISIKCWVPVRAGEMTEYTFAYLNDLAIQNVFPTQEDITSGRAGGGKDRGGFNDNVQMPSSTSDNLSRPFSGNEGNGGQLHVTVRPHTWGADPTYVTDQANQPPPLITPKVDTTGINPLGKKPDNTTSYQLDKSFLPSTEVALPESAVAPGIVVSGTGVGPYEVNCFFDGFDREPRLVKEVYCIKLPTSDGTEEGDPQTVPEGTPVMITLLVYKDEHDEIQVEYSMQPPLWL